MQIRICPECGHRGLTEDRCPSCGYDAGDEDSGSSSGLSEAASGPGLAVSGLREKNRAGSGGQGAPRAPRKTIQITVVRLSGGGKSFYGYAKNISRSGMLVHTLMPVEVGEEYDLEFTLPRSKTEIRCIARVVRNDRLAHGVTKVTREGLKFVEISRDMQDRIDEWITQKRDRGEDD